MIEETNAKGFLPGTLATATLSDVSVSNNQTHLIEASYTGDDNFGVSRSGTVALTTSQIATTLILRSSSNPVTLTATRQSLLFGKT